jgi:hypothetical protein
MLLLVDDAHPPAPAPGAGAGAGTEGRVFGPADFEGPAYSNKVPTCRGDPQGEGAHRAEALSMCGAGTPGPRSLR